MKLLVLLMMLTNVTLASTNFNTSIGNQGDARQSIHLGLEQRFTSPDNGIFVYSGYKYSFVDFDEVTDRKSVLEYEYYRDGRKDNMFYFGTGYKFDSNINISVYVGLGNSERKQNNSIHVREFIGADNKVTKRSNITIITNESKREYGLRLGYELGNEDIIPYVEYSNIKYGNENSINSVSFGASFSL